MPQIFDAITSVPDFEEEEAVPIVKALEQAKLAPFRKIVTRNSNHSIQEEVDEFSTSSFPISFELAFIQSESQSWIRVLLTDGFKLKILGERASRSIQASELTALLYDGLVDLILVFRAGQPARGLTVSVIGQKKSMGLVKFMSQLVSSKIDHESKTKEGRGLRTSSQVKKLISGSEKRREVHRSILKLMLNSCFRLETALSSLRASPKNPQQKSYEKVRKSTWGSFLSLTQGSED